MSGAGYTPSRFPAAVLGVGAPPLVGSAVFQAAAPHAHTAVCGDRGAGPGAPQHLTVDLPEARGTSTSVLHQTMGAVRTPVTVTIGGATLPPELSAILLRHVGGGSGATPGTQPAAKAASRARRPSLGLAAYASTQARRMKGGQRRTKTQFGQTRGGTRNASLLTRGGRLPRPQSDVSAHA